MWPSRKSSSQVIAHLGAVLVPLSVLALLYPTVSSAEEKSLKIVVHNNDPDIARQAKALGNVSHILDATEGNVEIVVISHGDGLSLVVADQTKTPNEVHSLLARGVRFAACENTMAKMKIPEARLLKNVTTVKSGAVEIARKQQEGYSYFKP